MVNETREVHERAEIIGRAAEEEHVTDERFRNRAAICVSVLAVLLAISSLNTSIYIRQLINTNIHANADEALYHMTNLEQSASRLALDELRVTLAVQKKLLAPAEQAMLQEEIRRYENEIKRLESDPDLGQGKKEVLADRHRWETEHHLAEEHLLSFESADVIYQVAIVLCSVCIVLRSRRLFQGALLFGIAATLFALNGFILLIKW
jgi:hypothetical protein